MLTIWQIVPRLLPSQDGVGDYALALARQLRRDHAIGTAFVCSKATTNQVKESDGFEVEQVDAKAGAVLSEILLEDPTRPVFLNYVPPGYDRNSLPFWLLRELRRWRRCGGSGPLVTMFHELYSEGPPWTRSFWTNPGQRYIGAQIARLSDCVLTSVEIVRRRMEAMVPSLAGQIAVHPVFSNVGEKLDLDAEGRERWLAVFGTPSWRLKAYNEFRPSLEMACARLGIERIVDIGAPIKLPTLPVPVECLGRLPADMVGRRLQRCRFAFITYSETWVGKSGIFAAYCANGCIPIMPAECRAAANSREGLPTLCVDGEMAPVDIVEQQRRVVAWYRPHDLANTAGLIGRELRRERRTA